MVRSCVFVILRWHEMTKGASVVSWPWDGIAVLFGWGMLASFRTTGFGLHSPGAFFGALPGEFFLGLVLLWPMWLAGLGFGLSAIKSFLHLLFLILISISLAEVFAGAQEAIAIQKYGLDPGREVWIRRWPPFQHSAIYFEIGRAHV